MTNILVIVAAAASLLLSCQNGSIRQSLPEKEQIFTGCLTTRGSAPKAFQLLQVREGPKSIGIVAANVDLAPQVGSRISVSGFGLSSAEAQEVNPYVPKSEFYLRVTSFKQVDSTCS